MTCSGQVEVVTVCDVIIKTETHYLSQVCELSMWGFSISTHNTYYTSEKFRLLSWSDHKARDLFCEVAIWNESIRQKKLKLRPWTHKQSFLDLLRFIDQFVAKACGLGSCGCECEPCCDVSQLWTLDIIFITILWMKDAAGAVWVLCEKASRSRVIVERTPQI